MTLMTLSKPFWKLSLKRPILRKVSRKGPKAS
jgi:hypothetical protein